MNTVQIRVVANQFHGVQPHINQPIGVRTNRSQAGIDDDLFVGSTSIFGQRLNKLLGCSKDVLCSEALGGSTLDGSLRGHHDDMSVVLADQFVHGIEVLTRCSHGIKDCRSTAIPVVDGETASVKFYRGVIKSKGQGSDLLDSGNNIRNKIEHFLRVNPELLGAVEVYREGFGLKPILESCQGLIARRVALCPGPARPGK